MKNKILICLSLFITLSLSGCLKKGDDDPQISLRSRKARVAGDWKLVSLKRTSNHSTDATSPYISSVVFTSDGKTYSEFTTLNGVTTTKTGETSQKWTFEKDGNYTITNITDAVENRSEGKWNFTSSIGEHKNKSQLAISQEKETNGGSQRTYTGNYVDYVYDIHELRNKTMVLYYHTTLTDASGFYEIEYETELSGE